MTEPLRFVFGIHLHQPVGNFDHVFEEHVREVYRPLLRRLVDGGCLPLVLHLSGPLLEWLERHDGAWLDEVGELAAARQVEMLLSGFHEPVLAALPRADRLEQIGWMRDYLARRFGVRAEGLWLTERVWEPDLAADLAAAGVRYLFVDDRHLLVNGFDKNQLHVPWCTEHDDRRVELLAIDERLRYLVPFREPPELAAYFRELRDAGHPLAILADDGEKFGGWPGTREWVYGQGWMDRFLVTMRSLLESGEVRLATGMEAVAEVPAGGLAYLPTASYREMETWSLPPAAARRLVRVEEEWGEERLRGLEGPLLRGSHWRNFMAKYAEANRMHKMMVALSALCRARGDQAEARQAIGRAQCNDAYWHGVFGGLYLPFLRAAIWRELASAEGILRRGEPLAWESVDLDADGREELWVHSSRYSAVVAPHRGGAIEVLLLFSEGVNLADALTRRREAYHHAAVEAAAKGGAGHAADDGAASIHDLERLQKLEELPPADADPRALFVERMVDGSLGQPEYVAGSYRRLATWASHAMQWRVEGVVEDVEIVFQGGGLEKRLRFSAGAIRVAYRWDPAAAPPGAAFVTELSCARDVTPRTEPAAELWRYPIATIAKSESGLEKVNQGIAVVARWPASLGAAALEIETGA